MDKGTTTCAKGEPEVVGRGSGSYPVEVHCYAAFLSGRGQIVQMGEYEVTRSSSKTINLPHIHVHVQCALKLMQMFLLLLPKLILFRNYNYNKIMISAL